MKELSIEEKAKAYDEAIERAKKVLLDCTSEEQKVVEYITPELKESEDERIRKELICFLETEIPQCNARDKYIAWLKKQGEQELIDKIQIGKNINVLLRQDTLRLRQVYIQT